MKAVMLHQPAEVTVEDLPIPVPMHGQVRLKVAYCGLCGSDLHRFRGDWGQIPAPAGPMGHEISGVVESLGAGVHSSAVGDRVCVKPTVSCGHCEYCRTGHPQLCDLAQFVAEELPGGFAEYLVVPADNVLSLPDTISLEEGALIEPLSVAVHAVSQARLEVGATVCVLGSGTIGLLVLEAARAGGAGSVFITAKRPHQVQAARRLGADAVLPADGDVESEIRRLSGGKGVDVCISTVGAPLGSLAMGIVRKRGRVVLVASSLEPQAANWHTFIGKELEVVGSHTYGYNGGGRTDFEVALGLVSSRRVDVATLITHRFPLERAADAFQAALDKHQDLLKALFIC